MSNVVRKTAPAEDDRPTERPPIPPEEFAAAVMAAAGELILRTPGVPVVSLPPAQPGLPPGLRNDSDGRYGLAVADSDATATHRRLRRMKRALTSGDFETALTMATKVLSIEPGHEEARACADQCRDRIEAVLVQSLGGSSSIPELCADAFQLQALQGDVQRSLLLSVLDGTYTLEEIMVMAGERRLEAIRWIHDLALQGLLRLT